jgi:hypothetical protein
MTCHRLSLSCFIHAKARQKQENIREPVDYLVTSIRKCNGKLLENRDRKVDKTVRPASTIVHACMHWKSVTALGRKKK